MARQVSEPGQEGINHVCVVSKKKDAQNVVSLFRHSLKKTAQSPQMEASCFLALGEILAFSTAFLFLIRILSIS